MASTTLLSYILTHDWTKWLDQPSTPLAVSGPELLNASPRASSSPIGYFLVPETVVLAVLLYLISIPVLRWLCENMPMSKASQESAWNNIYESIKSDKRQKIEYLKKEIAKLSQDGPKESKVQALEKKKAKAQTEEEAFTEKAFKSMNGLAHGFDGSTSPLFKVFTACHNLILIIFSGTVMLRATPIVFGWAAEHGWRAAYCDVDKTMWNEGGFGYWATIFYLSKFYEFVDTWILVCKVNGRTGKRVVPSLLQTYHHAGIALAMYGSTVSQVSANASFTHIISIVFYSSNFSCLPARLLACLLACRPPFYRVPGLLG